jgi:hypothetical protein
MAKLEMKISVTDIEPMKELLSLLAYHYDDLPDDIKFKVKELAGEPEEAK